MRESWKALEEAIERLPAASRAVLVLRTMKELSTAETARRLGLTKESVRVRLHRARRALRRALAER
jgi:RNA polymerase sigma-70 factor (ECF subfamily)